jgi:hypothetical protein
MFYRWIVLRFSLSTVVTCIIDILWYVNYRILWNSNMISCVNDQSRYFYFQSSAPKQFTLLHKRKIHSRRFYLNNNWNSILLLHFLRNTHYTQKMILRNTILLVTLCFIKNILKRNAFLFILIQTEFVYSSLLSFPFLHNKTTFFFTLTDPSVIGNDCICTYSSFFSYMNPLNFFFDHQIYSNYYDSSPYVYKIFLNKFDEK